MSQRTVADAFNQYHNDYVKPSIDSKIDSTLANETFATKETVALKAPIASPNFTGTPTAPTAGNDTDSTQLATTEFCQNLIRRLVGTAPETLDTLVELATALNNDPNFAQTVVQALDAKLNKTDAANTYLNKTAKASSASSADYATSAGTATNATNATKATQDSSGNNIVSTYATKTALANVLTSKNITYNTNYASDSDSSHYDWNKVTTSGFYRINHNATQSYWENRPSSATVYALIMESGTNDTVVQVAFHYDNEGVWVRTKNSSSDWNAWKKLAFAS